MNRNPVLLYKPLIIGVVILFVGIGIQPAFAVNVSNTIISDNEDECDICPKVSSIYNLEDEEKYQELSKRITTFKEMNKELNPNTPYNYPITICYILGEILNIYTALISTYNGILEFIAVITLFPFVVLFFILCYENPPSNII